MNSFNHRVCKLFNFRFGTHLKIKWSVPIVEASQVEKSWKTTFVYSVSGRQVAFPIFNGKKQLRAIALAGPVENNDAIRFQEMSDFLQLTLAESIHLNDRKKGLTKHNLYSTPIEKSRTSEACDVVKYPRAENVSKTPHSSPNGRPPALWLYGSDGKQALKVAYSLHEWAKNWALINIREIPDLFWKEQSCWTVYQQMSLLLPAAEDLTEAQWQTLTNNLQSISHGGDQKENPTLILTSHLHPEVLRPEIMDQFLVHKVHETITAQLQAHFLLFQDPNNTRSLTESSKGLHHLIFLPQKTDSSTVH